jgi:TRAP-type C4-dicarboxylate transport system permease small subunit
MNADRPSALSRLIRLAAAFEDALLVTILTLMIGIAGAQIVLRNLFNTGLMWADPALRVMVLWVGMIGAMVATRNDRQISIDAMSRYLRPRWRSGVRVITDLFTAGVSAVVAWNAGRLMLEDWAAGSEVFASVPLWVCELVLPIAFGMIALRYLLYAMRHTRDAASSGGRP